MKTLSASFLLCLLTLACGPSASSPAGGAGAPPSGQAAPDAEEEKSCRRSLTGPGKRQEGEECGGSTNLSCAEGLKCVAKYRCPGSIGTCQKQ